MERLTPEEEKIFALGATCAIHIAKGLGPAFFFMPGEALFTSAIAVLDACYSDPAAKFDAAGFAREIENARVRNAGIELEHGNKPRN